jgi:hypothetical protein
VGIWPVCSKRRRENQKRMDCKALVQFPPPPLKHCLCERFVLEISLQRLAAAALLGMVRN